MSEPASAAGPADGYVRFRVCWTPGPAPDHPWLRELDALRTRLWDRGWVGATPEGIGFGNLSVRDPDGAATLIITGTATGAHRLLGPRGYTRVTAVDVPGNAVRCAGPVKASAETMSHAALYEADPRVGCVIHIHCADAWARAMQLKDWPTTPVDAGYGTPALADAVENVARSRGVPTGCIVMAGHRDGLLAYGPDPAAAEQALLGVASC